MPVFIPSVGWTGKLVSNARVVSSLLMAVLWEAVLAAPGKAQTALSATKSVQLIAVKPASIGISLVNGGPVVFALNGAEATGNADPAWSVNWNLPARNQAIQVCAALAGPLTATSVSAASIPPSHVEARPDGASTFQNFSGTGCGRAAALQVSRVLVTGLNNKRGSKKNSLQLRINERGLNLPSGTYTGTLNIFVDVMEAPARGQ